MASMRLAVFTVSSQTTQNTLDVPITPFGDRAQMDSVAKADRLTQFL